MKVRCIRLLSSIVMVLTSVGCSVTLKSSQYDFIKGFFEPKTSVQEKAWQIVWRKRVFSVYAINHDSGTFFCERGGPFSEL